MKIRCFTKYIPVFVSILPQKSLTSHGKCDILPQGKYNISADLSIKICY